MADTKIASLTDGLTTSGTDRIPVAISPYGSGNNAYITPSYLKTFMVTGGTVTSSTPVFDMTQTWNSGAVTFSGLKLNITDTASASGSLLMDLQVGGTSRFAADKSAGALFTSALMRLGLADAASPVAQTIGVQNVVAGTSNTAGADFTIRGSAGTGTGAGGSIVFQTAAAGSTGTSQNSFAAALTLASNKSATFTGSILANSDNSQALGSASNRFSNAYARTFFANAGSYQVYNDTVQTNLVTLISAVSTVGRVSVNSTGTINWYSAVDIASGSVDLSLARDAANTLALVNGTNAQTFNIYNTSTSSNANYERGSIGFATPSNGALAFTINGGAAGGTGTGRELWLKAANNVYLGGSAGYNWTVNNTGHFLAGSDNIYDIGASGANRPRNVYVAGLLTVSGQSLFANNAGFSGSGNIRMANSAGYIIPQSDGVWQICDNTTTSFGRLQFGGTSSSFPALKRSTTSLQARLADDSAFTAIQGKLTTDTAYTATPPTCTGYVTIYDSTGTPYKVMVST